MLSGQITGQPKVFVGEREREASRKVSPEQGGRKPLGKGHVVAEDASFAECGD
jgi:hypothetical protein